ncbi:MAG TPA: dTDP-glucose 4,6-dehydratase [Phycisphaerae bacterium]|nr:dTDP-glucose 4,6-dehydratase [Phycisphaerae bacterium]
MTPAGNHGFGPILVTGGAGFIGSNFITSWLQTAGTPVVNLDKLTYAGNIENLSSIADDPRYTFVHGDINDRELVEKLLSEHKPWAIVHFAAESHVDRSIHAPEDFLQTNVMGTFQLLEAIRAWQAPLSADRRGSLRFMHVSTDEVYGSLGPKDPAFSETTPYAPNSPYSASKAASDHLVRAYHHTYGLPTLITNCSNNYGPYQFPEKLIPLMILNALEGKPLPVYGDGLNVRDWLYVLDHCEALRKVLALGRPGQTYNIGGESEKNNLTMVKTICSILDVLKPTSKYRPHEKLIAFVKDRPGHDRRYAMDIGKIRTELGFKPRHTFDEAIAATVKWYLENGNWVRRVTSGEYRKWIEKNYAQRG